MCKFTPMEFETIYYKPIFKSIPCVNLLRWSLKHWRDNQKEMTDDMCKFTPMEFETLKLPIEQVSFTLCKFTPMEFETQISTGFSKLPMRCKFTPMEFETYALPQCL